MRRLFFVVVFLFFGSVALTTPASAQTVKALPIGVELGTYGILPEEPMSTAVMAGMRLHPVVVEHDTPVYNYSHSLSAFILDMLKAGDIVVANDKGEWLYRANCSNRISLMQECPKCITAAPVATPSTPRVVNDDGRLLGFLRHLLPSWARELLKFFLAVLLLLLLASLLLTIGREMMGNREAVIPAPPIIPIAPPPPPVHPVLGQAQRGANRELWFGPFQTVTVSDRQMDGFHVNVDGRPVSTFTQPVRVENAGERGSWVVVTEQ